MRDFPQLKHPKPEKGYVQRASYSALFLTALIGLFAVGVIFFGQFINTRKSDPVPPPALPIQHTAASRAFNPPIATSSASSEQPANSIVPAASDFSGFGISIGDDFTGLNNDQLTTRLDHIVSLGITWLRFDADWSYIQPRTSTDFDWRTLDSIINAAHSKHLKVLPILDFTPRWARSSDCASNACAPSDPAQFAQFAAAAAARYAPLGVHTWEIWNEPNINRFWQPAPDAAAYAKLLTAAYASIKKVDPAATVISGGLASADTHNGNIAPIEFLNSMYQNGAAGSFDALGFHPYSFPVPASYPKPWNAWQQMANTNPSLLSVMEKHGDGAKKIWITEYGAPTNGPGAGADENSYNLSQGPDHVSEALQAYIIVDAVKEIQKASWAGPLFWYTYVDRGVDPSTNENFFGLLRYDGSPKPSFDALKQLLGTH